MHQDVFFGQLYLIDLYAIATHPLLLELHIRFLHPQIPAFPETFMCMCPHIHMWRKRTTFKNPGRVIHRELASTWNLEWISRQNFAATEFENMLAEYDTLSDREEGGVELTRAEFDKSVKWMKKQKLTVIDGVPEEEVWQNSRPHQCCLDFCKIWKKEEVPTELAVEVFVMIYKKGNSEDCTNYRCIGLFNHTYKIMTVILLMRLIVEWVHVSFFSDWQTGFRQ